MSDILLSDSQPTGYWAVTNGKLKQYLTRHKLIHYFTTDCWRLLEGLLRVSEESRWSASRAVNCRWFKLFNYCYDARVFDLFSLGTVLYHILANQPLYSVHDLKRTGVCTETAAAAHSPRDEKLKVYLMKSNAMHRMKWSTLSSFKQLFMRIMKKHPCVPPPTLTPLTS